MTENGEKSIKDLPRWARVALAARSARRLTRVLREELRHHVPPALEDVERAISLAEESAANGVPSPDVTAALAEIEAAINGAYGGKPPPLQHPNRPHELLRGDVGWAADLAARACIDAAPAIADESLSHSRAAAVALGSSALIACIGQDLATFLEWARRLRWDDNSPIAHGVSAPGLKITGLHIRGLGPIKQLDLPRDGLAWQRGVPDIVLLGGINGSGKTTLLDFIHGATSMLGSLWGGLRSMDAVPFPVPSEAWVDYEIAGFATEAEKLRFIVGNAAFVDSAATASFWSVRREENGTYRSQGHGNSYHNIAATYGHWFGRGDSPDAIFIPTERELVVIGKEYKMPGAVGDATEFGYRWRPPKKWDETVDAQLFDMRWKDLNAGAEGHAVDIGHFSPYADAFQQFTGPSKRLGWSPEGKLQVKLSDADVAHSIAELSSGEKQLLLLVGELLRRWRPGSLIMIDEPELHLHTTWQTKLYDALRYWQAERGGQIILATQSSHLFQLADVGTAAILGVERP